MAASAAPLPGLGGHVLGDGALGVEQAVVAVDVLGGLLDVGASRLQPGGVRDDQLVGVALLLGERAAGLDALGGVRDGPVERGPTGAEPEGGDHQAGVAEDLLGLDEPLALDAADEPVGVDRDVVEEEGGGVAEPDAVLVLGLAVGEARRRRGRARTTTARRARWRGSSRGRRRRRWRSTACGR